MTIAIQKMTLDEFLAYDDATDKLLNWTRRTN